MNLFLIQICGAFGSALNRVNTLGADLDWLTIMSHARLLGRTHAYLPDSSS